MVVLGLDAADSTFAGYFGVLFVDNAFVLDSFLVWYCG
jgi:hypothetical protein